MDHDFYQLFARFWWLLFPFFWMVGGGVRLWLRHNRAKDALSLIKSYVDQGKEPPPELMAVLQHPERRVERDYGNSSGMWIPTFLFAGLTAGFILLAVMRRADGDAVFGLAFVALVMGGLCLGFLVATLSRQRRRDDDPTLPK